MDKTIACVFPTLSEPAPSAEFERELVAFMPQLRIFSRSVCRNPALADDMVQQTLMLAWRAQDGFKIGTNMKSWLFTILRNQFFSHQRRAWRASHWDSDFGERIPAPANEQGWTLDLSDTARALGVLPQTQREALLLITAGGLSFQDTAKFCGTPIGTVKSRVTRARANLTKILDEDRPLPRRATGPRKSASDDILAQLSALVPAASGRAAISLQQIHC